MFIGSIQAPIRSVVGEVSKLWRGRPVYVGCSGNFTIESILADTGISEIHGNDVSMYTCAIGAFLAGGKLDLTVKSPDHAFLNQYIGTGLDVAVTMVLALEYLPFSLKKADYYQRIWKAALARWPEMHAKTRQRIAKMAETVKLAGFWPGDVVEFMRASPRDAAVIAFPPTYKNGYERMYKPLAAVFSWQEPKYACFDDDRMAELIRIMRERQDWLISWDREIPELHDELVAVCQSTLRSHPVNVYASRGCHRLAMPRQTLEPLNIPRLTDDLSGEITLADITGGQLNWLRSQYLGKNIMPASAQQRFAVLIGGRIAGAIAVSRSQSGGDWCDAYMLSDFAVSPTAFPRLSKLISAVATSREMQDLLTQRYATVIRKLGTTAFTTRAVSMKYRGVFELHSRKEGRLNYVAEMGRQTLSEVFEAWKSKHPIPLAA